MAAFRATVAPGLGSPPTFCGSNTASSPSTGTFFRKRRPKRNLSAAFQCSGIVSRPDAGRYISGEYRSENLVTAAGIDKRVAGLVYIVAFAPDIAEPGEEVSRYGRFLSH